MLNLVLLSARKDFTENHSANGVSFRWKIMFLGMVRGQEDTFVFEV